MKIAICTPAHSLVTGQYAVSLANMINWTLTEAEILVDDKRVVPTLKVFMRYGSLLPSVRNALVKDALDFGADYMLLLDADHRFPENTLLRLLRHNLPVVACNQPKRAHPTGPTAEDLDGRPIYTTPELAQEGAVQEVGMAGAAICLIHMSVIHELCADPVRRPLFNTVLEGAGISEGIGEDTYFFRRVKEAGFKLYVDHGLSWEITHVHTVMLSHSDTLTDKDTYLKSRPGPAMKSKTSP